MVDRWLEASIDLISRYNRAALLPNVLDASHEVRFADEAKLCDPNAPFIEYFSECHDELNEIRETNDCPGI